MEPRVRLPAQQGVRFPLSLLPSPHFVLSLSLSLSDKQIKSFLKKIMIDK